MSQLRSAAAQFYLENDEEDDIPGRRMGGSRGDRQYPAPGTSPRNIKHDEQSDYQEEVEVKPYFIFYYRGLKTKK